jgi:hypothetical protein
MIFLQAKQFTIPLIFNKVRGFSFEIMHFPTQALEMKAVSTVPPIDPRTTSLPAAQARIRQLGKEVEVVQLQRSRSADLINRLMNDSKLKSLCERNRKPCSKSTSGFDHDSSTQTSSKHTEVIS